SPYPDKIDPLLQACGQQGEQTDGHQGTGYDKGNFAAPKKIKVHIGEQVLGHRGIEVQAPSFYGDIGVDKQSGNEDGREQGGHDPDHQGRGKALDGPRSENKEDDRGQASGDVGIQNGGERIAKTVLDGLCHALALGQFLFYPLKYQNVGIHGHPDGQYNTGNSGQGQDRTEGGQ